VALRVSVSGSRFRFSTGTARTAGGALDPEAFGVVGELSSSTSNGGGVEGPASCLAGRDSEVEAGRASDWGSGGGEGEG
jgi:hypothetical protein